MSYNRPLRPSNGSGSDISSSRRANGTGSIDQKSRAEAFEDEKRRIIECCFAKKEPDGAFAESYITHIQIEEDASCPSSPPPPDSPPDSKKPRVIIVAVRRSGRVRLHKGRENTNGTFSIGKTWLLDHLSAIESFSGSTATTAEERQRSSWAGDTGMLVTVQKPYFWRAQSATEKDFFIGSLVKIFRKYTGGKEPELTGFSSAELTALGASSATRPKTPQSVATKPSPAPSPALKTGATDFSAGLPPDSAVGGGFRPSSSGASSMRTAESQDRMPPLPGQFPPDTPRSARPEEPRHRYQTSREKEPHSSSTRSDGLRPPSAPRETKSRGLEPTSSTESFSSTRQEAATPSSISNQDRFRTNGTYSPLSRVETPPEVPVPGPRSPERTTSAARRLGSSSSNQENLPERRRPPLQNKTIGLGLNDEDVPSPLEPRRTPTNGSAEKPKDQSAHTGTDGNKDVASTISNMISPLSPPSDLDSPGPGTEGFRPGLGPMIKKRSAKELAGQFRKAAAVANAFKPRAGGAGDRLRNETAKQNGGADGINGVFKAPSINKDAIRGSQSQSQTPDVAPKSDPFEPTSKSADVLSLPPKSADNRAAEQVINVLEPPTPAEEPKEAPKPAPEEKKKKRPSNHSAKYAAALGFDVYILEGRTVEFEMSLEDNNWIEDEKKNVSTEDTQAEIRKDLAKAETGTWLSSFEQGDERVGAVSKMLDKAIAECEELDGLLTLYDAELGTLNEDVSYIEAQSQGLQVQTANQRLLNSEQKTLLETISIPSTQLRVLKEAALEDVDSIELVETALSQLFKAMLTIDPKLRHHDRAAFTDVILRDGVGGSANKITSQVSGMRAVQEKKDGYRSESVDFILRLKSHMNGLIQQCEVLTRRATDNSRNSATSSVKIDLYRRDQARSQLWVYSPLMLFAREIDPLEWGSMLTIYERSVKRSYQEEHRECIAAWRRVAKKPTGDEQDILFTNQEKESEGSLVGRKLTVKRSKTLREGPRVSSSDKAQEGKILNFEAFAGALYDTSQSITMEQNFIGDIFHVTSAETSDFPDLVSSSPPQTRRGNDLTAHRQFDPDRNLAKQLQNTMEEMFSYWSTELQTLVDWAISYDSLQGVGVLCALESKYAELEDTNQEFIVNVLKQAHDRLSTRFDRFVDEQIRGIEETKVKIKKRKGVIAFIKTFPYFSSAVEHMLPSPRTDAFEIRDMVNSVYRRIIRAMFESLKFIAKESPVVMAGQKAQGQAGGEAEDKEILNYHILLIENMNHYVEEVDVRNNTVLEESKREAMREMAEHMGMYLDAVIRRPLGKLLDSVESTESLVAAAVASGETAAAVAARASHSRSIFKKILSAYDAKEVKHGIDALKKRVDKHFGNADDPGLSRNLVAKVLHECEERYLDALERTSKIVKEVYEGQLEIEFKKEDVANAFRR